MCLANVVSGLVGLFATLALEIQRHLRLEKGGKPERVIRELVLYNWPRTVSLTGSAFLTLPMFHSAFSPV
jgi:hypothetical protein